MRLVLLISLVISLFGRVDAQNRTGARTVLVVPFERFEFHTEMKLEEINKANGMVKDEFYSALLREFLNAFTLNSTDQIQYRVIEPADFKTLMKNVVHLFHDGHFMTELDRLEFSEYKNLLEKYNADFILFINWYRIKIIKRSVRTEGKRKSRIYTFHLIDYDVFNSNKVKILAKSNVKFEVPITPKNYKYKGVRLSDLAPQHKQVVDEISMEIYEAKN